MDANGQNPQLICSIHSSSCLNCPDTAVEMAIGHCFGFSQAVFSPDGQRIAFLVQTASFQTGPSARLVTINPDGSQPAIGPPIHVFRAGGAPELAADMTAANEPRALRCRWFRRASPVAPESASLGRDRS